MYVASAMHIDGAIACRETKASNKGDSTATSPSRGRLSEVAMLRNSPTVYMYLLSGGGECEHGAHVATYGVCNAIDVSEMEAEKTGTVHDS